MKQYRKKPIVIHALNWDEFIALGKELVEPDGLVEGMPWSFEINGHPVTHENDELYILPTLEGEMNFTPNDMLIIGVEGEIYPCKKTIFDKTYEPA